MSTIKQNWGQLIDDGSDSEEDTQPQDKPTVVAGEKKPEEEQQTSSKQYSDKRPRQPIRDPDQQKQQLISKLEEVKSNKVWIFIFKHEQFDEKNRQKIEGMKPERKYSGQKGWDILLPKDQVKQMIDAIPEKKNPRFLIGNKNFRDNDSRPRGDDSGRNNRDRNYNRDNRDNRDRDNRQYDTDSYKRKYREKEGGRQNGGDRQEAPKGEGVSQGDEPQEPLSSSEYGFKKNRKNNRNEEKGGEDNQSNREKKSYRDNRSNQEPRPPKKVEYGTGLGAFRLGQKPEQKEKVEEPKNLVDITKQSSKVEEVSEKPKLDDIQFRRVDSTPASTMKKRYVEKKDQPESPVKQERYKAKEPQEKRQSKLQGPLPEVKEEKHSGEVTITSSAGSGSVGKKDSKGTDKSGPDSAQVAEKGEQEGSEQAAEDKSPTRKKKNKKPKTGSSKPSGGHSNNPFDAFYK